MNIEKFRKKINLSGNKKDVAKISFGTLIGQGINFVSLPILTRIYGAEIIGIWTLLNSIAVIINSFSDLGLTNSIMLDKEDDDMLSSYEVISTIVLMISILSGIIIVIYYSVFPQKHELNLIFIGFFIAIACFTLQQIQVCYTWLNRKAQYNVLMKNPLINNLTFSILAILLGILGIEKYGYFIGWILGQILTLIHMKRFLPKSMFIFSYNKFKKVLFKKKEFIKYQLPTNIFSNVKGQIPVVAIKALFGNTILGYYSVTVRVMQIPITLLASAMGRVFFQNITDMKRKGKNIGIFVYNNIEKVMKVAIIPIIAILVLGDYIVVLFLGKDWVMAGDFIRILALQNFFNFLMMTVQGIAITLGKQKLALIFCIIQSICFLVGLSIGKFIFNNPYIGIGLMSISFVICNIIYFCLLFKHMKISWKKYLLNVFWYIFLMYFSYIVLRGILYCFNIVDKL